MNKSVFFISILIILIYGCSPKLVLKNSVPIKELAICTDIKFVPDSITNSLDSITNRFIEDYNSEGNQIKLVNCQNDDSRSMYLDVLSIRITNPGMQTAGVVFTTIGVITPVIMGVLSCPFYVAFAYLPRSNMKINMRLSDDIALKKTTIRRIQAGSKKYFGSYQKQKNQLFNEYYNLLKKEVSSVLKKYNKQ